jgi:DNA polymerase-1
MGVQGRQELDRAVTGGVLDGVSLRTITSIDDLAECKRWAGERRETPLMFDTESAGLSPYRDECRLIQIGDMRTGWAAPAKLWGGGVLEILRDYRGELGAHNAPYDYRVIDRQMGLKLNWAKIHDTLPITHLNDSLGAHGLKPRAAQDIDPRAMVGEKILQDAMAKNHWTWATVPLDYPGYTAYGALDPVLTAHLFHKHGPKIMSQFREAYDLERATGRIAAGMMDAGMLLDVPYIERQIEQMETWQRGAMAWLRREFGLTSVNSAAQIERALHSVGIPTLVWTKNGAASTDKDTLKLYANTYPEHRHLIETISYARKTNKIVNDHLRKFLELRDSDDVIHASINTCQARTSRQSVTDPPMQTFDRDVPMIRGSYRPRPGSAFVTVDADQIEARMAAHFSDDPGMIEMFHDADGSGIDFFRLMAGRIFQEDPKDIPKFDVRRQLTKNSTYARIYGSGLDRMALTAGVPVAQAEPVYNAFGQMYPGLDRLMQRIIMRCKAEVRAGRRGFVTTPTGRVLYTDRNREYAGLNYMIQGHSAEILKLKVIELDAAGLGPFLRLTIHDEIMGEFPKDQAKDALATMTRILTDRETYRVPLTWDGKILEERWVKG